MKKSGIDVDFFLSNEVYDDVTYQIATTLSEEMNMTLSQVLVPLENGGWYILHLRNIRA
jgi:glycosyltransferase A (GT-A) superfamily protein (DUF2064 family)